MSLGKVGMASKLFPATPRPKAPKSAGLDLVGKTLPTAKHGTGTLEESMPKPMPERRSPRPANIEKKTAPSRGVELHQVQEDLAKTKEQLGLLEKSKSNLMQDLARAKRNVEELTAKLNEVNKASKRDKLRAEEMEHASFAAAEDCQAELDAMKQKYDVALLELQTNKQAMESLKHELIVCVEAKDEAVRLAGEAMNAAESTARRVEELSAELFTTKGSPLSVDSATTKIDELMDEFSLTRQSFLETDTFPERIALEGEALLTTNKAGLKEMIMSATSASAEIEAVKRDLAEAKHSEMQLKGRTSTLEALQNELAAAEQAEHNALDTVLATKADIERAELERQKARSAESDALALVAKVSTQLEEAQEKLVKVTLEGAALVSFLESLKAELERSQQDVMEMRSRETDANLKAAELNACLVENKETNQAEIMMLKERETSAHAAVESLKIELERQKFEVATVTAKETVNTAKAAALTKELQRSKSELIEHQKQSRGEVAALRSDLQRNQVELLALKERESMNATKTATLMYDLEKKQSEVVDLQERLSEMDVKARALTVELSTFAEKNSIRLVELREREADANAKVVALNAQVCELKQALEEALKAGKAANEELVNLYVSLQKAILEKEEARGEAHAAHQEAEINKQNAMDVLAKAQAARDDAVRVLEAAHAANNAGTEGAISATSEKVEAQAHESKVKLQATMQVAQIARTEVEEAREQAQSTRQELELLKTDLMIEKEKASDAREGAKVMLIEVEKLRTDLFKAQLDAKEAKAAWASAVSRFQDATKEMEAFKSSVSRGESNDDYQQMHANSITPQEMDGLKKKLQVCEERLVVAMTEVEALQVSKEELLKELEAAKVEREVNKRAVFEAHQNLADMEKAKLIMEADIQRLLDDSKLWKASKDTRDIPVHSEMNGTSHVLVESREEKPQPDSPEQAVDVNMALAHVDEEERKEEVAEKEEDMAAPAPLPVVKKKKNALLHRLHSYLDKKKSPHIP